MKHTNIISKDFSKIRNYILYALLAILFLPIGCSKDAVETTNLNMTDEVELRGPKPRVCTPDAVGIFDLAEQLEYVANCNNLLQAACGDGQTEVSGSFYFEVANYCSSGGCPTCADQLPSVFTASDQAAILNNVYSIIETYYDTPCGTDNLIYNFGADCTLCTCGTDCGGGLITSNCGIWVTVSYYCCQYELCC